MRRFICRSVASFPLDIYWHSHIQVLERRHPRYDNHLALLDLRRSCMAMEAVVGLEYSACQIGLSNTHPNDFPGHY
jgi:hypothetical protein